MFFLFVLILIVGQTKAQTIRMDNGVSFSSIRDNVFQEKIYPYHFSFGLDYLNKKFFYLSSDIGYVRKGGQFIASVVEEGNDGVFKTDVYLDYITVNTLANVKYDFTNKIAGYIGIGPRIDFKLHRKYVSEDKELYQVFSENAPDVKKISAGLKCKMGINCRLSSRFWAGIYFSYLPSFTKVFKVKENQISFGNPSFGKERLFGMGISVSYKI